MDDSKVVLSAGLKAVMDCMWVDPLAYLRGKKDYQLVDLSADLKVVMGDSMAGPLADLTGEKDCW